MRNRYDDALAISAGACNLSGITRSLIEHIDACRDENVDPANDPAIRLIIWQMAYLARTSEFEQGDRQEYINCLQQCQEKSPARQAKLEFFNKVAEALPEADAYRPNFTMEFDHILSEQWKIHGSIDFISSKCPYIKFHAQMRHEDGVWRKTCYGIVGDERRQAREYIEAMIERIKQAVQIDYVGVQATDDPGLF